MSIDPHRLAEERSLAAHRLIASRLTDEPHLLEMARTRVDGWLANRSVAHRYAEAWRAILAADLDAITAALIDPSERGRALRQCTPFAGAIDPRTRWRIWAQVRAQFEASDP